LTGDFVSNSAQRAGELAELLGSLRPVSGVLACLGNHDFWHRSAQVAAALRKQHIEVLLNQQTHVACAGGQLAVAGLESAWSSTPDWPRASRGLRPAERAIVLMHEPDFVGHLCDDRRIALQLS